MEKERRSKMIPGVDFPCEPEGDCWCKEIRYTSQIKLPIPLSNEDEDNVCYSPEELKKLINLINP